MNESIKQETIKFDESINKLSAEKDDTSQKIATLEKRLSRQSLKLRRFVSSCGKIEKNVNKGKAARFFLSLITLFIFRALNNKNRLEKMRNNTENLRELNNTISVDINSYLQIKANIEKNIYEKMSEKESRVESIRQQYAKKISEVRSLDDMAEMEDGFILLKNYYGNDSLNKIKVGCYVIKNNINGKVYVGQSKNIPNRIRTHFDGLVPKNHIFFEDYHENRENNDLFSVKIIQGDVLKLDLQEMELIDKYNAFELGYNKTAGNSTTFRRLKEQTDNDQDLI